MNRKRARGTPALAGALLLLAGAGCAAAQAPYAPASEIASLPATPPERVEVAVPTTPPPDPDADADLGLEALLAYADRNAPALKVARERARRGDAEVEGASVLLQDNPELEVGLGTRRVGGGGYLEAEAGLAQTFEIAGERGLRIETASRLREVARAETDQVRWEVHARVHALFFESLVARERVAAAAEVVRFAEQLRDIAARRVEAGEDAPLTMLVARADLAQAREALVAAREQQASLLTDLAEVAGWPSDRPLRPQGDLPPILRTRPREALLRLAGAHHPALRVRALAVAEAEARVRLAAREAWPEPTVGFAWAREGDAADPPNVGVFTLGIPLPVWNRNQGDRALAGVEANTARAELDAARTRLAAALGRAANQVDAAAERVRIYGTDILPTVQRNLELIRRAYDLGEMDIHAVSQTRERVLNMQARAIDARGAYYRALAELEALVGTDPYDAALQETTP